tara:strand:- start:10 stop:246 length:237 start_codon:yes stop_codon:yes gene_type:complete
MLSVLLAVGGCNVSSSEYGNLLIQPVTVYEVDGWGSNPDIYEFTPKGHNHMTCLILVSGGDQSGGLTCFPKTDIIGDL